MWLGLLALCVLALCVVGVVVGVCGVGVWCWWLLCVGVRRLRWGVCGGPWIVCCVGFVLEFIDLLT